MTKSTTDKSLYRILDALALTIDSIGYVKTLHLLDEGRTFGNNSSSNINKCAIAVVKTFDISLDELLRGKNRKYPYKYAYGIFVYLCYTELGYKLPHLSILLDKHKSNISRAKTNIEKILTETDNNFNKKIIAKLDICKDTLKELTFKN